MTIQLLLCPKVYSHQLLPETDYLHLSCYGINTQQNSEFTIYDQPDHVPWFRAHKSRPLFGAKIGHTIGVEMGAMSIDKYRRRNSRSKFASIISVMDKLVDVLCSEQVI